MQIYVKRENWDGQLLMKLPISSLEAEQIKKELKQAHPSVMIPFIGGVESEFPGLEEALTGEFVFEDGHLELLNKLAKETEEMNQEKRFRFQAAIEMEQPQSLKDVLHVLSRLERYSFQPEIRSYEDLGRYAAHREKREIPEELEEFFDYEQLGRFWECEHGCLTEGGWVEKNYYQSEEKSASEKEKKELEKRVLVVEVRQEFPRVSYERFYLPMPEEDLKEKLKECKRKGQEVVGITGTSSVAELYNYLPPGCSMEELNGIAGEVYQLQQRTELDWKRMLSALEAEVPATAKEACQVIGNYRNYELLPRKTKNPELYGRYLLEQKGSEIPDNVKYYIRYEELGKKRSKEAGLIETGFGMLVNRVHPIRREDWKAERLCICHPLTILRYDPSEESIVPKDLSGKEALAFKEVIEGEIEKSLKGEWEGALSGFLKNKLLQQKIQRMYPYVEEYQGELKGVLCVETKAELLESERQALLHEWNEIARFGWGDELFSKPVQVGNKEIYIGFFGNGTEGEGLFVEPEELFPKEGEGCEMKM